MKDNEYSSLTQHEFIDKKEHLIIRLIMFIFIYVLINYFILAEIYLFLNLAKNQLFTFLLVFLSLSYVLGATALRYSNNVFALTLYVLGSVWLGTMVLAATIFVFFEVLVFFNLITFELKQILMFLFILFFLCYSLINARNIVVKTHTIKSHKIKKPLTIVQISDLHVGAGHKINFLKNIIKQINQQKPDVTFITGDLIDGKHEYIEGYFDVLNEISSPIFMVVGNHERMTGMDMVEQLLKNSKTKILRDEQVSFDELNIMGIDDTEKSNKLIQELNKMKINNKYNILLFHRPKKFKLIAKKGVDLMLTGHTHAGQIFPMNILLRLYYPKVNGLKKFNNSYLKVSPGTGWWGPPMRLGSRNEITVFKLRNNVENQN